MNKGKTYDQRLATIYSVNLSVTRVSVHMFQTLRAGRLVLFIIILTEKFK